MQVEETGSAAVLEPVSTHLRTTRVDRVFWSHFSPNLAPSAWVIGVLVVVLGLPGWTGFSVLLIGNLLGSLPVALCAVMGPETGLPQMEASRFSFGRTGKRLPSLINWANCVGWDAVNNVPSALAFILLLKMVGLAVPFWLALGILAFAQLLASMGGHDIVQAIEKYLGWVLLVSFAIVGGIAVFQSSGQGSAAPAAAPRFADIMIGIGAVSSFNMAWAAYASDYTRYVPPGTPSSRVFWLTFGGTFLSSFIMELFGLLTGAAISDPSPGSVIAALQNWSGVFAPVALAAVAFSSIAINAANDNTAAYALISGGVHVNRMLSAVVTAGMGYLLAVLGEGTFVSLYENYLLLALYWIAPWCGIVLADWYCRPASLKSLRMETLAGWTSSATLFVVVTVLTIGLFSSTPLYTGPVAAMLGGADVGYLVGFFLAALGQVALLNARGRRVSVAHFQDA
ncbi:cytosine/purines uracil thiamine allantoin permease [Acetobacter aceti NRIC 0242]|uniref:Cytosine permease n=1 Tax=Acetobacter aceti NBRC 14818 TaxID=887700 RepID=A0AB33I7Q3_ACEAC|nr:cytosine permease [Acetobacter aceti]TCS34910.1 NCS1 family nucleobase:cation symporter-1 [Acetobacter aceti NBRC 14818]BCK74512.1 cytosine permease [Acetobacter aceti NBRC 14818]GAN56021.1 cytosine/purines uracil thiamine allantoin permease [Acetobacter aceti NBRC 14818]GBO80138.1 cytosine/purines uracil thiamine allantoin permease [Acetobacter aceti NRIC 0242]